MPKSVNMETKDRNVHGHRRQTFVSKPENLTTKMLAFSTTTWTNTDPNNSSERSKGSVGTEPAAPAQTEF